MTAREAKEFFNKLPEKHLNDKLAVPIAGLSSCGEYIKSMGVGFDWWDNRIMVTTDTLLLRYESKKLSLLKRLLLNKISKLKFKEGKWEAKFQKETQVFDKEWSAKSWVYEKLENYLEENKNKYAF
jgi:hypothetical protein